MNSLLWGLPGPSRFLDSVANTLSGGCSVLLVVPENGPPGLRHAISRCVREEGLWFWRSLDLGQRCEGEALDPVDVIAESLLVEEPDGAVLSAKEIAESECLASTIVWVEGFSVDVWSAWRDFVVEYAHVARAQEESRRAVFCMLIPGDLQKELPSDRVALTTHHWRRVADRLDTIILLSHLMRERDMPAMHRQLFVTVGAEVAGVDFQLAVAFSGLELREILEPYGFLCDYARELSWTKASHGTPSWEGGTVEYIDEQAVTHSALLALLGDRQEIERRVWAGEVAVLFPVVERERLRIIEKLEEQLILPLESPGGTIYDPYDLEIGQLMHLVYQKKAGYVDSEIFNRIKSITEIRHSLAHLQPAPVDLILDDGFMPPSQVR